MNNIRNRINGKLSQGARLLSSYIALKIYTKYNNKQGMYRNFKKMEPIYKNKHSYYYKLSKLAYAQKKWNKALNYVNIAINLTENSPIKKYYLLKAYVLIELNEIYNSISLLKKYLVDNPKEKDVWLLLAKTQKNNEMWEASIESYETYIKLNTKDSISYFNLAESYRKLNDIEKDKVHIIV